MTKKTSKDPTDQFIKSTSKWMRVLAGPGTGKSFCLKQRILHHVRDEHVAPERILVLTFTSVAAQDLRNDITKLSNDNPGLQLDHVEVSTLHALALKQLEKEKHSVRKMEDFEIETMLRDLEPKTGGKINNKKEFIDRRIGLDGGENPITDEEVAFAKSLKVWLKQHRGLILDNLIPYMYEYLQKNNAARKRLCYDRVLVDEYQDLNPDARKYVELLTSKRGKLAVIGDDDQAIYSFKGALPDGIQDFVTDHPGCEDIRFTVCRRCPTEVVASADKLIKHNKNRIDKEFVPYSDNQPGSVDVLIEDTSGDELNRLCDVIRAERNSSTPPTVVVMAPGKNRKMEMYRKLKAAGIPVELCKRGALLKSKAVRENISYLTLAANPNDMVSWRYLLGGDKSDKRSAPSYLFFREAAKKERLEILDVLEECASGQRTISHTSALVNRYKNIKENLEALRTDPYHLFKILGPDEPQYEAVLHTAFHDKLSTEGFEGVRRLVLEKVYSSEAFAASDKVRIMTMHAAKGLSAQMVIIMSAVEGLIPQAGSGTIEEQRRLFYVAITRCKGGKVGEYPGKLIISSYSKSEDGTKIYTPTRFIREMGSGSII